MKKLEDELKLKMGQEALEEDEKKEREKIEHAAGAPPEY